MKSKKNAKKFAAAVISFCLLLCSPVFVAAKDYSSAKCDATRWDEIMEDYLDTKTDRLIFVKCGSGTNATVEMWEKVSGKEGTFGGTAAENDSEADVVTDWKKIVSCRAYIGKNGLDKKKEGDRKTPVGIFNISMAFGRKKSPGTAGISYTKLNRYHYWSSEKDTYNQFVDVRTLNREKMNGEHLISYDPWYNYALALDYNKECTYKKGAAIFLHCVGGGRTYTMGCIAVSEKNMKTIVRSTTEHTKICIFPSGAKASAKTDKQSEEETAFKKEKPVGVMATAVNGRIAVSWEPVSGADEYEVYEAKEGSSLYTRVGTTADCRAVLEEKEAGAVYSYYVRACKNPGSGKKSYSKKSAVVSTTVAAEGISTIKNFLKTALAPVGSAMYVWGGGWNEEDTGAGPEAVRIGVSPSWRSFASGKNSSYNYKDYRYQIHKGLDCSGYVGWTVYNVLNTKEGEEGYVYSASKQAKKFSELGFGSYSSANQIKNYKAGDIMSSTCKCCGHVWIVVGQCSDGSVVLLHSSPAGVQINGTVTPQGKKNSQAVALAKKYMKKYYGEWYQKFPKVDRGSSYLSHYGQMRWRTTGKNVVLSDPDGYQDMSAEEVLKALFE